MWWPILFWVLGKLIDFLIDRYTLTDAEKAKVEKAIALMNAATTRGVFMGCNPQGRAD